MIGVKCEMGLAEENRSKKLYLNRLQGQGELDEQVLTWWSKNSGEQWDKWVNKREKECIRIYYI